MPYCEQCGIEYKGDSQFCENCGAGLVRQQPFARQSIHIKNYAWLIAVVLIFVTISIIASIPHLKRPFFRKIIVKAKTEKPMAHELGGAQSLLEKINSREKLRGKVAGINATGINGGFSFFIDNTKIIIGRDDFDKKLGMLEQFLSRKDTDLNSIEYIDLRFKDVVIKKKDKL